MRGPDPRTHADSPPAPAAAASDSDWPVPPPPDSHGTPVTPLIGPAKVEPSPLPAVPGHQVLRRLGRGGMGEVFDALHLQLGRRVALKLLAAERADDPAWLARFRTEATAVARVRHPNVVAIYEVGDAGGRPYLSLELVTGGSLAERLRGGLLAPRAAAELARDLARGVHAVHAAGVVHRDLKPGNILVSGGVASGECVTEQAPPTTRHAPRTTHQPKIADFGLAHLDDSDSDLTRTGAVLGTPSYMAPEQAAGGKGVGPAADVYAVGAILYECVTGRPPFKAATALETLALVKSADPVPPGRLQPGVPRDLETVVLTCLRKEPGRRYASAAALADDLQRFLDGEPVQARPVGRFERAMKWCRRRPAAAALVAVIALAAAGAAAGLAVHESRLRAALARVAAEKERADADYRAARAAFRQMLARFDDRRYGTVPRARELRNAQYEDALAFFAAVVARQNDPDPEVRNDVARSRLEAARLQLTLGRVPEAEANLRASVGLFAALEAELPGRPEFASGRAGGLLALSSTMVPGPRAAEGRPLLDEALAIFERLAREYPDRAEYRDSLAAAYNNLGTIYYEQKDVARARDYFRLSTDLRADLVRELPAERRNLVALAQCYYNLSALTQLGGDGLGAKDDHDRAEAALERLLRDDPNDLDAASNLAIVRMNWAYTLDAWGRPADALADLEKNVALLEPLVRIEPTNVGLRDALYRTFGVRATLLDRQRRYADAARAYEKVVEYATAAKRDEHLLEFAQLAARGGLWKRALEVADDLTARRAADTGENWSRWPPRVYGLIAAAVRDDKDLSPGERGPPTDRCARQAAAVIGRAKRTLPADEWRKYREALVADEDFKALTTHGAVKEALRE